LDGIFLLFYISGCPWWQIKHNHAKYANSVCSETARQPDSGPAPPRGLAPYGAMATPLSDPDSCSGWRRTTSVTSSCTHAQPALFGGQLRVSSPPPAAQLADRAPPRTAPLTRRCPSARRRRAEHQHLSKAKARRHRLRSDPARAES
jgi:hypothetical protein